MPTKSATPRRPPRQSKLSFKPATPQNGSATTPNDKKKSGSNGNILNFFRKVEVEEQLFISDPSAAVPAIFSKDPPVDSKSLVVPKYEEITGTDGCDQGTPIDPTPSKRRKLSHGSSDGLLSATSAKECDGVPSMSEDSERGPMGLTQSKSAKKKRRKGPFLADSDSEDDGNAESPLPDAGSTPVIPPEASVPEPNISIPPPPGLPVDESCLDPVSADPPDPQRDELDYDQFKDLEDMEGLFGDDEDAEFSWGEEFRERQFMEEEARLEDMGSADYMAQACPICNTSLDGTTPEQATVHVNACLDGNPPPAPEPTRPPIADTVEAPEMSKRFAKAAVPRPGQPNPISLSSSTASANGTKGESSAFSKLMSGHAEDSAWASAAASEHASRGKPAYQRTCPFYKIMPGFYICVDAFRYGAVKGCNAYFLSHFHSDHYIGLTANWSHGPIYCSKVTGSLIKNQLRTNAKYIKELEFEETVEVPGTEGVTVTMLPANHCPGSSLFLFEKKVGKGTNARAQRILHCGDFRACPAQVAHPLLRPETLDAVSGKVKQQKIDVCYLDTTYLNPRYSFPLQDDVVRACAEFCKSLSGDPNTADEAFDRLKREKGSTTVSSFFPKGGNEGEPDAIKHEDSTSQARKDPQNRLLVVCGTYSIGKERICKAIAQALNTKIFASASKIKICSQLGDPELAALMTSNPYEAQVHMQMLMEIRAETLQDYLDSYKPHFTRIVGFRPSGWNFRPSAGTAKSVPTNTSPGTVPTTSILHSEAWRPRFGPHDFVAQRGSSREAMCFGVPYSEHSSFRELAVFLMTLRIEKVVPTVNVGSEVSRKRMKAWTDRWLSERRKGGIVRVLEDNKVQGKDEKEMALWDGKDGKGGGVYW
ncbi:DRMBL-domain-containing protein [Poronia punctata]|nr:DRMBL-domain-containing protein [Poronia punctata]